jgi:GDP-D-mannose dehydratase
MLQQEEPDDYVIATSKPTLSVTFFRLLFIIEEYDCWRPYIVQNESSYQPVYVHGG